VIRYVAALDPSLFKILTSLAVLSTVLPVLSPWQNGTAAVPVIVYVPVDAENHNCWIVAAAFPTVMLLAEVKFAVRRVVPLFLAWALERVTLTDAQRAALDAKLAATLDAAFGPATPSASP